HRTVLETARQLSLPWLLALVLSLLRPRGTQRETDDERAAAGEQRPARQVGLRRQERHGVPALELVTDADFRFCAARRTARRIRIWVPQRHRLGCIAARICSSDGAGLFCSSA